MGIISRFGDWLHRMFVPDLSGLRIPTAPPPAAAASFNLNGREGGVLVKEDGVSILYPPNEPSEEVIDTISFLHFALTRADWQDEWMDAIDEGDWRRDPSWEPDVEPDDEPTAAPALVLLDGGLPDRPREHEPGPFARDRDGDPGSGE